MPIPRGYAVNVCRLGQGQACCRYLALDQTGLCCAKVVNGLKQIIDQRVSAGVMIATGDNCPGWSEESDDPTQISSR